MSVVAGSRCTALPWDSEFFGFPIARLHGGRLTAEAAAAALTWCRDEHVRCLYFLADAGDAATLKAAARAGFELVDIRVTLTLDQPTSPVGPDPRVRMVEPEDLATLEAIARAAHGDSRFYVDGRFPRDRCDALYATWIRRSCHADPKGVLVALLDGAPAGYLTCTMDGDAGQLGLVGVAGRARGLGLGGCLVSGAVSWFAARRARSVAVVTQGRNVRAQALYQKHGFRTSQVELWYHRWFGDRAGE